ncbi:hypothetical protein PAMP_017409 [Pampus punctatissimus]
MAGLLWFVILMPLLQPELTVTPPVITKHESVTLNCETRSSMFVTECYFMNTISGKLVRPVGSSCQLTLTGSELLITNQKLSAEVKVKCYYTVKTGDIKELSTFSDASSVIIQSAAENNKSKTESTTSISKKETKSPVGGGDKGLNVNSVSTPATPVKLAPGNEITGICLSGFVFLCLQETVTATINLSTKGSKKPKGQEFQSEDPIYHNYATISEVPAASALEDMVYSTVQTH